jgi:hypothetical protein
MLADKCGSARAAATPDRRGLLGSLDPAGRSHFVQSSFRIVAVATASSIIAPTAPESFTENVPARASPRAGEKLS